MKLSLFFLILISKLSFLVSPVSAQCPVCIITVGGGMLIAKKLGIDDFLVSIWISALNTAIAFWLAPKIKIKFLKNGHILALLLLATTLSYFYFTDQIGPSNQILGFNKIVFGQIFGLITMAIANHSYLFVKKKNNNRAPFPYAKVVFPLALVTLITIFFKLIFKL
jgi:hypothetical protein